MTPARLSPPPTAHPPTLQIVAGDISCCPRPTILQTTLGSCVAVCLWDRRREIGGMNHFMLPYGPPASQDGRYGDVALPELLEGLLRLGADRRDLQAKLFGGADVLNLQGSVSVGLANLRLATGWLAHHDIPVLAQRTGGRCGRQVRFLTGNGEAFARTLPAFPAEPSFPPT